MTLRDSLSAATSIVCRDTWGQPVSYTPASTGVAEAIEAVVDERVIDMPGADGVPFTALYPTCDMRLEDLSVAPKQGDALTTAGQTYEVVDVRPDGHANSLLILMRTGA